MILLFDIYNLTYAGYHALKGQLTSALPQDAALFGFLKTMMSRLSDCMMYQHVFWVFDHAGLDSEGRVPSWRHQMFPEYKANRNKFKDEAEKKKKEEVRNAVYAAIEELRQLSTVLPVWKVERYNTEADDLIGAIAHFYSNQNVPVQIVSGDKDMRQLINELISVWIPSKGIEITNFDFPKFCTTTKEKISIPNPNCWLVFRTLTGDASDNISGIKGFGDKSAAKAVILLHSVMDSLNLHDTSPVAMLKFLIENPGRVLSSGDLRGWKTLANRLMLKEWQDVLWRNYTLMNLGYGSEAHIIGQTNISDFCEKGEWDRNNFWSWLTLKQFNSITQRFNLFDDMAQRS